MKNKKLFAILTLVCFMLTLMPVAAFAETTYAEVNSDYATVKLGEIKGFTDDAAKVVVNMTTTGSYYVYAVNSDGAMYKGLTDAAGKYEKVAGVVKVENTKTADVYFYDAGDYTVYVTPVADAAGILENAESTRAQKLALLKDEAVTMLDNKVTVKPASSSYAIALSKNAITVQANSGYSTEEIVATLTNNGTPVVGATLKISTNSSAVDVDKTEVKTNAAGQAKFKVSASTAGEFKVYVEYGTKADETLTVTAGTLAPAKITTVGTPNRPIALDSSVAVSEVSFTIADANGNTIKGATKNVGTVEKPEYAYAGPMWKDGEQGKDSVGNYKVAVTEKPAGSAIDADEITVRYNADNAVWLLSGSATFDEEGDYTIKVTLSNGNYAVAKVTVKEFQTPVELKMTYKQNAVELNGSALLNKLYYVDANGTQKSLISQDKDGNRKISDEVVLSANGYAVRDFEAINGTVKVKSDEKYVGSKINVLAVSDKYNLTASVELTVANEASSVKYAKAQADVAVNNTLTANIVDQDGNKVALNNGIGEPNISYVVLEKPENSKVAISTLSETLAAKGEFKVSFTASEIGTYKVQTVVRYEQAAQDVQGTAAPVVKYYSGIEEITVGNTGFEDIVVMSIGSNEIVVNADKVAIDAAPMVQNDRTYVPFRALAEAFGATVAYDEATQAVTAELNGTTVVMTIGSATYTINGVEKTMDVAPFINGSRTMIPVRFAAEAFGITVTPTYDENGATADVLFAK